MTSRTKKRKVNIITGELVLHQYMAYVGAAFLSKTFLTNKKFADDAESHFTLKANRLFMRLVHSKKNTVL